MNKVTTEQATPIFGEITRERGAPPEINVHDFGGHSFEIPDEPFISADTDLRVTDPGEGATAGEEPLKAGTKSGKSAKKSGGRRRRAED